MFFGGGWRVIWLVQWVGERNGSLKDLIIDATLLTSGWRSAVQRESALVVTRDIHVLVPSRVRMTQPAKSKSSMNAKSGIRMVKWAIIGQHMTKADLKEAADSHSSVAMVAGVAAAEDGEHVYSRGEMGRSRSCFQQDQNKMDDYRIH